jgi:AcrR family transcriptional regulator
MGGHHITDTESDMPRLSNTRELILDAALNLFSERGYDGVGLRDLAREVGIRESALYKHFGSKQEILDHLAKRMYDECIETEATHDTTENPEELVERYRAISVEELIRSTYGTFMYFAKARRASKFRKIMTMEQFRNEKIGALYRALYFENVLVNYSAIFKGLMDSGTLIEADPDIVALHFYSPIFLLLTSYDEQRIDEAELSQKLEKHIRQFMDLYLRKE